MTIRNDATFSVVLLHYDQEAYWRQAVDSILAQDYPAIELVVSDDASPNFDAGAVRRYVEAGNRGNITDVNECIMHSLTRRVCTTTPIDVLPSWDTRVRSGARGDVDS